MKKFLSLVLALVMTMSLVTISAGAEDFTDAADINYEEAVAVISAVGVVNGYADGSFNPEGGLTRQAAAKIICNMILGPTTAAELDADTAPYPDVAVDSDFAGYIAYCQKEGIISGYADGTFKGANPLTGYAFMKMLLGALGYDGETEGYTGANWSINVAKKAIGIGLNAGLKTEFNGSDFVTREEAALYAFNTLRATMVEYDQQSTIVVGDATVTLAGSAQDLAWGTGTLNDGKVEDDGFVQFAEKYFSKLTRTDDISVFGQPANTWTYNKKDIGTYVDYTKLAAEYTVKVEGGDVYSDIGSVAAGYDLAYWQDGVKMDKDDTKTQASQIAKKNDDKMGASGNGVLTQVYVDNDAEELTIVEINTYLAETDDYNEKKETLKFNEIYGYGEVETMKLEDCAAIADYVDGDMVLLTIADGEVQSIVDAESISDVEIEEFSKKDYVITDGDKYAYAATGALADSLGGLNHGDLLNNYDNSNLNDTTFALYFDTYGYLIGLEEIEATAEYVFITAYDRPVSNLTNKTAEANAIFVDGTQAVIQVNVGKSVYEVKDAKGNVVASTGDWGADGNDGNEVENKWFKYTVKNDVYTLTIVENQFVDNKVEDIDSKHISQYDTTDKLYYYGNADTNYIVVGLDEVNGYAVIDEVKSVTTGVKNVSLDVYSDAEVIAETETKAANSQGVYTLTKTSGAYIIASIVIGDDGETSSKYAYLYDEPLNERYSKSEDAYYWTMNAVMDGEETTITFKSELPFKDTSLATFGVDGTLFKVTYEGDYAVNAVPTTGKADNDNVNWLFTYFNDPDEAKILVNDPAQGAVDLEAEGDTLWITAQNIERGYALADECPAVMIEMNQAGTAVEDTVVYSTVAKAIKALDNYDDENGKANFDGTIYLFVKEGLITSVILTDSVDEVEDETTAAAGLDTLNYVTAQSGDKGIKITTTAKVADETDYTVALYMVNGGEKVELDTYKVTVAEGKDWGFVKVEGLTAGQQYQLVCGDARVLFTVGSGL